MRRRAARVMAHCVLFVSLAQMGEAVRLHAASCDAAPALRAAATWLDAYDRDMTFVSAEEHYTQREVRGGAVANARTLRSTLALVNLGDGLWTDFRDVYEVDGRAIHGREDRVLDLLQHPAPDALDQARRIATESARYNLGSITRTVNTPTLALTFIRGENQNRSVFACESEQSKAGATTVAVRFTEQGHPRVVASTDDAPTRGRVWIQADTGRVVKTELWFDSGGVAAHLTVGYALDSATQKWVPISMDEQYDVHQSSGTASAPVATGVVGGSNGSEAGFGAGETIEGHATYTHFSVAHVNVIIR